MNKITMYELLGMIKDDKAPKTIKSEGHYYCYNEIEKDYYEGMGYDYEYLFKNTSNDRLNDEVEIIEEEKKIPEKIQKDDFEDINEEEPKLWIAIRKINEIIDYLKSKGE